MIVKTTPPEIHPNLPCARCGSKNVVQNINVVSSITQHVQLKIEEKPNSWLGNKAIVKPVYADLCTDCGHINIRIHPKDAKEIGEAYQKRENNLK